MQKPLQYYGCRRLDGYSRPIARICVDGVEKDIFHQSEFPSAYQLLKVYNQVDGVGHMVPSDVMVIPPQNMQRR